MLFYQKRSKDSLHRVVMEALGSARENARLPHLEHWDKFGMAIVVTWP